LSFYAYIMRWSDGTYHVGHTEDLNDRVAAHRSGILAAYKQTGRAVELVWSQAFSERSQAVSAERLIKGWSRAKKEALIRGEERIGEASPDVAEVGKRLSQGTQTSGTPPVVVLVRPQLGQNIGKAARAMLNFGLTEMRLVAPRDGWPNPDTGPSASGADVVLERAQVFATTQEAIADCSTVFAATVRRRDLVMPVIGPEAMADRIGASPKRSAILFGPERSGLETEEVALANAIVTVPINPEFASLNLAQAVILLAYEWSKRSALAQPPAKDVEPPAPHNELEGLIGQLEQALETKGYYHPPSRTQATKNTVRTIFTKAGWSSREVKAVRGIIRALVDPPRRRK
jgi:tRNA/rRNA methyltransferase